MAVPGGSEAGSSGGRSVALSEGGEAWMYFRDWEVGFPTRCYHEYYSTSIHVRDHLEHLDYRYVDSNQTADRATL